MKSPKAKLFSILCVLLLRDVSVGRAQDLKPSPSSASTTGSVTRDLEEHKWQLEKEKLENERERTGILKATESRISSEGWMRVLESIGTPLSILLSFLGVYLGLRNQVRTTQQQLASQTATMKAQFRLTAAELVMSARSANQLQNKAKALAALFPEELSGFGDTFQPGKLKLGRSVERRQALIELLAAHPGQRREIIETWALLFPDDKKEWLAPLLTLEGINPDREQESMSTGGAAMNTAAQPDGNAVG